MCCSSGRTGRGYNFSFHTVAAGRIVRIPTNQQMVLVGPLTVAGTLILQGTAQVAFAAAA